MAFVTPSALPASFSLSATSVSSCPRAAPSRVARVTMHGPPAGHGAAATEKRRRPGEHKGFVEEMRFIAMKLHTKDQASEGTMEKSALPIDEWFPPKESYMQFLVDSRHVYTYFETELVYDESNAMFIKFQNTGLERLDSLNTDITLLQREFNIAVPLPTSAATKYVDYMKTLIHKKPESVLCHWYNYYFAHSAGGRMIGRLMQDRLFDGRSFAFYEWEGEGGDVKAILNKVRVLIDDVAKDWPADIKEECLKETGLAFGYSGTVLQNLAKAAE